MHYLIGEQKEKRNKKNCLVEHDTKPTHYFCTCCDVELWKTYAKKHCIKPDHIKKRNSVIITMFDSYKGMKAEKDTLNFC